MNEKFLKGIERTRRLQERLFSPNGYEKCYKELLDKWNKKKKSSNDLKYESVVDELLEGLKNFKANNNVLDGGTLANQFIGEYTFIDLSCIRNDLTFSDFLTFKEEEALKYLLQNADQFTDSQLWSNFKSAYVRLSGAQEIIPVFKAFLTKHKSNKKCLMTESERSYLDNLPKEIQIHRGMSLQEAKSKRFGISWTLDKSIAEFFANKHPDRYSVKDEKTVVSKVIPKEEVIAYFDSRNEKEIIWISNN